MAGNVNSEHVTIDDGNVSVSGIAVAIYRALKYLSKPIWLSDRNLLVKTDASGSIGTVTTVSTVTNISQLGAVNVKDALLDPTWKNTWANKVRRCIT